MTFMDWSHGQINHIDKIQTYLIICNYEVDQMSHEHLLREFGMKNPCSRRWVIIFLAWDWPTILFAGSKVFFFVDFEEVFPKRHI